MLAAHRDRENLVQSHQVPTKQNPKTPGARYPKTPSRFNDENAPSAFAAKGGGVTGLKTNGKPAGGRQALMTPMGNQNRAVLGNKTTNAKARTGQTGGVKGIVNELEKTTVKPTTTQRPRHRAPEIAPIKFDVKQDSKEGDEEGEPEYAPPPVKSRPYESDVLPLGLSMEGLKDENLLKGYYNYYHDPVDANGVSRKDKQLEDEMERLVERAAERNERDLADLDWTARKPDNATVKAVPTKGSGPKSTAVPKGTYRNPGTVTSRRAAAALSQPSEARAKPAANPATATKAPARRPLSSLLQGSKTTKRAVSTAQERSQGPSGPIASRTTLGYNKGRSASSMVHPTRDARAVASKTPKQLEPVGCSSDETITPARARNAMRSAPAPASPARPQFLAIFDELDDDEDLPAPSLPQGMLEEEEEEFELRLDI